jgi:hypothetical protein
MVFERHTFDATGIPTSERHERGVYVEATKVWLTSPRDHPANVQWLTDYVGDFPSEGSDEKNRGPADAAPARPTRAGQLHNLCGIPVFAGIPIAALASAATAVRNRDNRWACYSAGSSAVMAGTLLLFGAAIRGQSGLRGKSGVFQRISIAIGLGWLSSLPLRGLSQ